MPEPGPAERLPDQARERARWERHVVEVITGLPPDAPAGVAPRPDYDPAVCSLAECEAANAAELAACGVGGASARPIRRRRQRYQAEGIDGSIDGRTKRTERPGARFDPRVLDALLDVVAADESEQLGSADQFRHATAQRLASLYGRGAVAVPSRSTFHWLLK